MPFRYGLCARAVTEALVRLLRVATDMDPRATVLSIGAVGVLDHVSRQAMLAGLMHRPRLQPLLLFARQFCASNSTSLWQDASGDSHEIRGEQGDPVMPAFDAIAQHPALAAVNEQLREGEAVFAYLDDIYYIDSVAAPERIRELQDVCKRALREHARMELNRGKTRIWNAGGEEPANISDLRGQSDEPSGPETGLSPEGILVRGTPFGTDEYMASTLAAKRETQQRLLTRIPDVPDLQACWLLLHFCAAPGANYLLRNVPPPPALCRPVRCGSRCRRCDMLGLSCTPQ